MSKSDISTDFLTATDNRGPDMSSPDFDFYRPYFAHFDMTDAQKDEAILSVWRIMQNFVDRAFGDDPVQHIGRPEDKLPETDEAAPLSMVASKQNPSSMTIKASVCKQRGAKTRGSKSKKREEA